ncbi:porin family protein [Puniceicoccales bacterium CK1056]|uniref:Porin family protein n=1 Tax=Oceanipulchritudo coccoides TaxID=2706888 RepID=A0A6B2M0X4_9BACT|nr:outer membrane beta-barrel protein [Oceanipulchritudo coccoides]NDV61969.1 porin family protein [Oceanipulchritudo coccoides]
MKKAKYILTASLTLIALMGFQSVQAGAYLGAGVGYMIDSEEELLTVHFGYEVAKKGKVSHNVEIEIGHVEDSEMGVDLEINPLMLNYRAVNTENNSYDLYFGLGIGTSNVDVDVFGISDDDNVLTVQAMVGMDFKLNQTASLRLGYRYLYLESVELFDYDLDDLDDHLVEVGLIVKF